MLQWNYLSALNKTAIVIGTGNPGAGRKYGVGQYRSGIDYYVDTVVHEARHVNQISTRDILVGIVSGTSFSHGWSWNQALHNHWGRGVDMQWGVAGIDDDGNLVVDDAAVAAPFELGFGDDNLRSGAGRASDWPLNVALPSPDNAPFPEESDAINAADAALNEDDYLPLDWGSPGKQHQTTNWND